MNLSEQALIELKAKVKSLEPLRKRLEALKAEHMGNFQQIDTYFYTPKGRLKLRQIDNRTTQLIYYEREDISKPKKSEVFIMDLRESRTITALLKRILKVKTTVKKRREIYRYKGTQIHLDTVDSLGYYVEFERETCNAKLEKDAEILEELLETLKINPENLERLSYADLVNSG